MVALQSLGKKQNVLVVLHTSFQSGSGWADFFITIQIGLIILDGTILLINHFRSVENRLGHVQNQFKFGKKEKKPFPGISQIGSG